MTTPTSSERHRQLAAFYAAHATHVHQLVGDSARAAEAVIEDACQTAWTILLRRPDITLNPRGLQWLITVATHEAWRLAAHARETRETPRGGLNGAARDHASELPEPANRDDRSAEQRALDRLEHHDRAAILRTLKPREREALLLHALGYSYAEIATLTDATYTAVNRRITEGRAALRRGGRRPRHAA